MARAESVALDHLVWSIEHDAWWGPDECGYTCTVEDAGRYSRTHAEDIATGPDPLHPRTREKAIRLDGRHTRVGEVNALVRVIAGCGRRFFSHGTQISRLQIDGNGRLWWLDKYSHHRVYIAYRGRWRHFTEGGTLRDLVRCFGDYVRTGQRLPAGIFGPWPSWVCNGDLWGYGDDMATIRAGAVGLLADARVEVPA